MSSKKAVHFAPSTDVPSTGGFHAHTGNPVLPMELGVTSGNVVSMGSPYHTKQSPPFRTGGRGSKQLSKAIEHFTQEKHNQGGQSSESEHIFFLYTGEPIYFAKYVSMNCQDVGSVLVQKMQPSHIDPALLAPWEGHLCIVKSERLQRIEMKKEPAGWRILETAMNRKTIAELKEQRGFSPSVPPLPTSNPKRSFEDWDYVSLESSDFDEASSRASSFLFQSMTCGDNETSTASRPNEESSQSGGTIRVREKMNIATKMESVQESVSSPLIASKDGSKIEPMPAKRADAVEPSDQNASESNQAGKTVVALPISSHPPGTSYKSTSYLTPSPTNSNRLDTGGFSNFGIAEKATNRTIENLQTVPQLDNVASDEKEKDKKNYVSPRDSSSGVISLAYAVSRSDNASHDIEFISESSELDRPPLCENTLQRKKSDTAESDAANDCGYQVAISSIPTEREMREDDIRSVEGSEFSELPRVEMFSESEELMAQESDDKASDRGWGDDKKPTYEGSKQPEVEKDWSCDTEVDIFKIDKRKTTEKLSTRTRKGKEHEELIDESRPPLNGAKCNKTPLQKTSSSSLIEEETPVPECTGNSGSQIETNKTITPKRVSGVSGLPPKPSRGSSRKKRMHADTSVMDTPTVSLYNPLPKRRAATQGNDYAKRNSFLGSFPTRSESAARGSYRI